MFSTLNYNSNQFPKNIGLNTCLSIATTTSINFLLGRSAHTIVAAAALAGTITIIEALCRPLIQSMFPSLKESYVAQFVWTTAVTVVPIITANYCLNITINSGKNNFILQTYLLKTLFWKIVNQQMFSDHKSQITVL